MRLGLVVKVTLLCSVLFSLVYAALISYLNSYSTADYIAQVVLKTSFTMFKVAMYINLVLGRKRFQYTLKTQVLHTGRVVILAINKFGHEALRISLIERGKEEDMD